MVGSCFSDEIGEQMEQRYMQVCCNPFGTLYNPLSIAKALTMDGVPPLVEYEGLWHSMMHHGSLSRAAKEEAYRVIRNSVLTMEQALEEASVVIITFGTAWVYEVKSEKLKVKGERIVANCHKMPEQWFTRRRLTVEEIVAAWQPILEMYADKRWIFTVSPIRHVRDGLHENEISKATLLMAIERMIADQPLMVDISYFPSYEIMMDELRDYRFYADDLVHPSSLAVNYIWERFVDTYCTNQTKNELVLQHKRWKHEHHIPLH